MFMFHNDELVPIGYTDSNFQSNKNSHRSTYSFVFTLGGVTISWISMKQFYITNSSMKVKYVATLEVAKKVV